MSDEDCTSYKYFQRALLVGSNAFFLLATIYCIRLTWRTHKPWYTLVPEIVFLTATAVFSALYHMCDDNYECTRYCVTDWIYLYKLDFIFSYQVIQVVFAYAVQYQLVVYKVVYLMVMLLVNIIYINSYYDQGFENKYYIIVICAGIAFNICRVFYLWRNDELTHDMIHHFDLRAGIPALIFAVAGIAIKMTTPNDITIYWWMHSLWHIFIALAIYFAFNMYDLLTPLCICCIKKKPCETCHGSILGSPLVH